MNRTSTPQPDFPGQVRVGLADEFPPAILDDYFHKRQTWFVERRGTPDYDAGRDAFDDEPSSLIALASDGRECLGGVRLTIRTPRDNSPFPSEELLPGLAVREAFPDLKLDEVTVGEMGKLLIAGRQGSLPFNNRILLRIAVCLLGLNRAGPQAKYAFLSTQTRFVRIYQQIANVTRLPYQSYAVPDSLIPSALSHLGEQVLQVYQLPLVHKEKRRDE